MGDVKWVTDINKVCNKWWWSKKRQQRTEEKNLMCVICSSYYRINCTIVINIGCSFKFSVKVGVEESIVNAPLV
jgi:hypothetical protein